MGKSNVTSLLTLVFTGIQTSVAFATVALPISNKWRVILLLTSLTLMVLLAFCIFSMGKTANKYQLVQYLFHNEGRNKFNSFPKMLLLMYKQKKCNNVDIKQLGLVWKTYPNKDAIDSIVEWNICGIENPTRKDISDYILYNTYDIGKKGEVKLCYEIGKYKENSPLQIKESNKVRIISFAFPRVLRPGKRLKKIQIKLQTENSLKLDKNDALCIYPLNYGKKIDSIKIDIRMEFLEPKYELELLEIGRINRGMRVTERVIDKGEPIDTGKDIQYSFCLNKQEIKMNNAYVVLLKSKEL